MNQGWEIRLVPEDWFKYEIWHNGSHVDGYFFFNIAKRKIRKRINQQAKVDAYNERSN